MCVCVCIHVSMYLCVCVPVRVCVCVCMCVRVHECVCVCMSVCVNPCGCMDVIVSVHAHVPCLLMRRISSCTFVFSSQMCVLARLFLLSIFRVCVCVCVCV